MILLFSDITASCLLLLNPTKITRNPQLGDIYLYNGLDSTHLGN